MTPIDALAKAIEGSFVSSRAHRPGVIIEHLPSEWREALRRLTSDDALRMRAPKWAQTLDPNLDPRHRHAR